MLTKEHNFFRTFLWIQLPLWFEMLKLVYLMSKKCRRTIYLTWMTSPSLKKHCSLITTENVLQKSCVLSRTCSSFALQLRHISLAAYRMLFGKINFPCKATLISSSILTGRKTTTSNFENEKIWLKNRITSDVYAFWSSLLELIKNIQCYYE